jgi:hypothetical protein
MLLISSASALGAQFHDPNNRAQKSNDLKYKNGLAGCVLAGQIHHKIN